MQALRLKSLAISRVLFLFCGSVGVHATEISGQLDFGGVAVSATRSWGDAGLGKLQHGSSEVVGQLSVRADIVLPADIVGTVVMSGGTEQTHSPDLREAWIGWNPLPDGPWRSRVRVGAFIPDTSLEVEYHSAAWTPARTVSNSAINSWFGEELRTNGLEWSLLRRGVFVLSPFDYGITLAAFAANDPAGTLLAWRGWSVGDRVTGQREVTVLADLPVFRPDGAINKQTRNYQPFREVDHRLGFQQSLLFRYGSRLELVLMHYDNRGDPLQIVSGQYSWRTRLDHLAVHWQLPKDWLILMQFLKGTTEMGPRAVALDFTAGYLLISHPLRKGDLTLRYDRFYTIDRDETPLDPNGETGHSWALAYRLPLNEKLSFLTETLQVDSDRSARTLLGERSSQRERRVAVRLRWKF